MTPDQSARRLQRAERRVEILEQMIEDQTRDLHAANRRLNRANADLATTQQLMPGALLVIDGGGYIVRANDATRAMLGFEDRGLDRSPVHAIWPAFDAPADGVDEVMTRREVEWRHRDGTPIPVLVSVSRLTVGDGADRLLCIGLDLRERKREEIERRHAQKLEALGQLAAGVAHEINTPMQYISDNLHLLQQGYIATRELVQQQFEPTLDSHAREQLVQRWRYFSPRLDRAFTRATEGVSRVTDIIGALKLFSHPRNELAPVDINRALQTTLTVARPEIKPIADVALELTDIPEVLGHAGDLNQVFLNLLVNAAHAIVDAKRPNRGRITVATKVVGERVHVAITDTGCGIPVAIRERVFDPFFTTKEPGRGTGQGLALAHAVIVERHGGRIRFDTEPGCGTTFVLELPIAAPAAQRDAP